MFRSSDIRLWLGMAVTAFVFIFTATVPVRADLIDVNIYANVAYQQTSGAPPASVYGYFFDAGGDFANPGDFDSASLTYPGPGSPQALTIQGTSFQFNSPYSNQSALQVDYPFGTYTITATNSHTSYSNSGSINYTADYFTSDVPALTAASYNGLNGLNPADGYSVQFNAFAPNSATNYAATFFTVYNGSTGAIVFTDGFLSPSTTSVVIPAHTLLANTAYDFELDFSNRIVTDGSGTTPTTTEGFDSRTDGRFMTGAVVTPEPSTFVLTVLGLLGIVGLRKKLSAA